MTHERKYPRSNELTAVVNRDLFDIPPGAIRPKDMPRWTAYRNDYHKAAKLELVTDFPLQIDFELNSTCQMKCGFCLHGHTKVPKRHLTFEQFCKVIDEGAEHGLVSIKLNYINEPLLNKDLPMYVDYARSRGVLNIYFATNGLLLTEDMSRRLIESKVSKIMISLDAATPETFFKMRANKNFDQIVNNIYRFLEIRGDLNYPLVRINFLQTPVNQHEATEFISQWKDIVDMVGFQQCVGLPGVEYGEMVHQDDFRCAFPYKLVAIDSAGNILPCCTFSGREMPLGHIDDMTIAEAWNGEKMTALREQHRQYKYAENPVCAHCINGG